MTDWPHLLQTGRISPQDQHQLAAMLLMDANWAEINGARLITQSPETITETVQKQWHRFTRLYPAIAQVGSQHFSASMLGQALPEMLWRFWLPLANQLVTWRQRCDHPLIVGLLGGQGTGKTTLGLLLTIILNELGYGALSLSLDDLYKSYHDRQQVQATDPRLNWRGPPGTHDLPLGLQVLDHLHRGDGPQPVIIPRFDKSAYGGDGDRTTPTIVPKPDIILFEGWFVGVRPIDARQLATPPWPIQTDADRQFALDMNDRLHDYLPLWHHLDRLIILHPQDYRLSQQWRQQAEQQHIAAGGQGMSAARIQQFVTYFWKALHPDLFITPLTKKAEHTDLVVEIQPDRALGKIYRPGEHSGA